MTGRFCEHSASTRAAPLRNPTHAAGGNRAADDDSTGASTQSAHPSASHLTAACEGWHPGPGKPFRRCRGRDNARWKRMKWTWPGGDGCSGRHACRGGRPAAQRPDLRRMAALKRARRTRGDRVSHWAHFLSCSSAWLLARASERFDLPGSCVAQAGLCRGRNPFESIFELLLGTEGVSSTRAIVGGGTLGFRESGQAQGRAADRGTGDEAGEGSHQAYNAQIHSGTAVF